jgi:protein required for attachment to host cells
VEIEALTNPAGRLHNREINADAAGRFRGPDRPGGNERRSDRLYLIAAPKFLGQLRKELGKDTGKLVGEALDRDLSWFDLRSLEGYVARQN